MKQTAVEYYRENILKITRLLVTGEITTDAWVLLETELLKEAKQMEKEQMIEFGYACANQIDMNDNGKLLMVKSPKELYNEKYGGNNAG